MTLHPRDPLHTVVAVMDRVEGRGEAPRAVINPEDVAQRVNQAYAAQGVACDAADLRQALRVAPAPPVSPLEEAGDHPVRFSFLRVEPLRIFAVFGLLTLAIGGGAKFFHDPPPLNKVNTLLTSAIHQPLEQAMAHLTTDDALQTIRALDPRISLEITRDHDRHDTITIMAPKDTTRLVGDFLLSERNTPAMDQVELWANDHRVTRAEDLALSFACPDKAECSPDRTTFLTLRKHTPEPG